MAARDDILAAISTGFAEELKLFDVSNPLEPVRLSAVELPRPPERVAIDGDLVAVTLGARGLHLYIIADPAAPQLVHQTYFFPYYARSVAIADGIVFVGSAPGTAGSGIGHIFAVDQVSGLKMAEFTTGASGTVLDFVIDESYLYAALVNTKGIFTFERESRTQFKLVYENNEVDVGDGRGSVCGDLALGNRELLVTSSTGFASFNLADPPTPQLAVDNDLNQFGWRQIALDGSGNMVAAAGQNSTTDGDDDVQIYNVGTDGLGNTFTELFDTNNSRSVE